MSTETIPYLGRKISLVSKAKIRYEGILYTIDTNESTVALAKVRSLGTEDRPTDRPVPARDEVYEYIIFRGSDIEDLHVCEPYTAQKQTTTSLSSNMIQDPAIVKTSAGPVSAQQQTTQQQQQPLSSTVSSTMNTMMNLPTSLSTSQQTQKKSSMQTSHKRDQHLSPMQDSSVQVDSSDKLSKNNRDHKHQMDENNRHRMNQQRNNSNNYYNQRNNNNNNDSYNNDYQMNYRNNRNNMMSNNSSYNQMTNSSSRNGFRQYGNQRNHMMNQMSQRNQQYMQMSPRQNQQKQRPQHQRRSNSTSGDRIKVEPLKFEGEFNFEEANDRFQEIQKEFENKLKISSSKPMSGNVDSSSSTSMTQQELQDQAHILMKQKVMDMESSTQMDHHHSKPLAEMTAEETKNFYDKSSSFFDKISCEANEKLQQMKPKNWKEERKMNAETFGMVYNERMNHARNYYRNNNNNNNMYNRRPQDMQQRQYRNNNNNMMNYNKMNQRMSMPMNMNQQHQHQQRNNGYMQYRRPEMEVGGGMYQQRNYRRYNIGSR